MTRNPKPETLNPKPETLNPLHRSRRIVGVEEVAHLSVELEELPLAPQRAGFRVWVQGLGLLVAQWSVRFFVFVAFKVPF